MMNYSAFQELDKQSKRLFFRRPWAITSFVAVSVLILGLIAVPKVAPIAGVALLFVLLGAIFGLIYDWKKSNQLRNQTYADFALANGLTYRPRTSDFGSGTLFQNGHSKKGSMEFSGKIAELPFRLFRYDYATGSGKNQRSYDAMIVQIELPRVLPHMVIDSEVEIDETATSILPISFDKSQKLELEGDFARYFNLYAPDKYGITALTVLAPDVMDCLMRNAALCDIEIIDNNMYFYWPKVAKKAEDFEAIFRSVEAVLKETEKVLTRQDVYATVGQQALHADGNTKGVRLKSNTWRFASILVGLVTAVFVVLALLGATEADVVFEGVIQLVAFGSIIYAFILKRKKQKKFQELQKRFLEYQPHEAPMPLKKGE